MTGPTDPTGPSDRSAAVEHARRQTIGDLLRRTAARMPTKVALVFGARRWTFGELDAAVNRTANALRARGVVHGDRIAVLSHNCDGFVVVYFALARLGAISVPVNFALGPAEVAFVLGHCGAGGMVAEEALVPVADAAMAVAAATGTDARQLRGVLRAPGSTGAPPAGWEDVETWLAHPDADDPDVALDDDAPIQLLYTSGTESRPKGAVLSSRSLIAQYTTAVVDGQMSADDIEVHALPLYHCAQLHCFLTPDIWLGATSIVLPAPDPAAMLASIEAERATKLFAPPTVWIALLRSPDFATRDLSSLRKGYYGAAIMPTEVLREIDRRLPDVSLFNFYGQTEMAPVATILRPEEQLRKLGSAGRAGLNVETRIVDDDDHPVPAGVVGEIVHRSPHAMTGYWNDPARSAEAFRHGWFHSGDLGVLDADGYLTVVDRKKDMIKTGGENVASREVEEVIYAHPAVAEVAVFGVPHPYWIEAVTAVVVPRAGQPADPGEIQTWCRDRLAGFKVPKYVEIAAALPKNPSGKILKRELRTTYGDIGADGAPQPLR
jgi:fatty-acyl-CoA synthase